MDYRKYMKARNASWKILLDLKIGTLPVRISWIIHMLGISLHTYTENEGFIKFYQLEHLTQENDGFTLRKNGEYYIFYNEFRPPMRLRFTLAHELGHILCGHMEDGQPGKMRITTRNTERSEKDAPIEQEANVFASRLLAPACVLHELQLFSVEQIAQYCQISKQAAAFRLKRILQLEERDRMFWKTRGHGCYYQHPLEIQVVEQFRAFIDLHGRGQA